jgi:hypothetical protein
MTVITVIPQEEVTSAVAKTEDGDYVTIRLGKRETSGFKTRWMVSTEMLGRVKYIITDSFGVSVSFTKLEYFGLEDGRVFFSEREAREYYRKMVDMYQARSFVKFLIKRYCK